MFAFEYAVIRLVPRVDREEFLNVGVILYCKEKKFLKTLLSEDFEKIDMYCGEKCDTEEVRKNLVALKKIASGTDDSGAIGALNISERFRWLTAIRSTSIQTSRIHPGRCIDPESALRDIFEKMVL